MKKLIYTFIFCLMVSSVNSQWMQCNGISDTVYSLVSNSNFLFAGSKNYGVFLSNNNGNNWIQTPLNNESISALATNSNYIFAGTALSYNGIYLSTNNGSNWTQTSLNNRYISSLAINGNTIFAGTNTGIYLSTNSGSNWTVVGLNNSGVLSFAISGNYIFAGTNGNGIYFSTNNGNNWTQTSLTGGGPIRSLAIIDTILFAGTTGSIYISTNYGSNWIQKTLNGKAGLSFATFGNNLIVGTDMGVYLSTDNGSNWINKNQGFSSIPSVRALLISNNYIFSGTTQSVWRRSLSEVIGINQISQSVPSSYKLEQNYPNPFNPSTNIRYQVKNEGIVNISVFDIQGKEIEILVNEKQTPSIYEVTFDGCNYSSGVYLYKITSGDFSETRKMVLIK
jgi:hypothetical protein